LSRPEIGYLLEALGAAADRTRQGAGEDDVQHALRFARSCYDHLAGQVAVLLTKAWLERGFLAGPGLALGLTPDGERWFKDQGIDTFALRCQRRRFIRGCLDWTERQPHVGGALGAAWLEHCLKKGWVSRIKGTRAVRISNGGLAAFRDLLGFEVPNPSSHVKRSA